MGIMERTVDGTWAEPDPQGQSIVLFTVGVPGMGLGPGTSVKNSALLRRAVGSAVRSAGPGMSFKSRLLHPP